MKLESRSKNLLAITRSKAKMYEFRINENDHIKLQDNPNKLLTLTISILGELSAATIHEHHNPDNPDTENNINELKEQLSDCAQFFDALDQSKLSSNYSDYLKILAASAYYLAEMPGSSQILVSKVDPDKLTLTNSRIEELLLWVLVGDLSSKPNKPARNFSELINNVYKTYCDFYLNKGSNEDILNSCNKLRSAIYSGGTDRELLIGDIIYSVIIRRVTYSSIICLPKYSKIPLEEWYDTLKKESFIKEFWPAQRLIGEKGVLSGRSSVIQMPTSAGKTKSTELIIRSSFKSGRSRLAVIIAPFRSLCHEITDSMIKAFHGENITVNELLDIPQLDTNDIEFLRFFHGTDLLERQVTNSVVITTPEKLVYILRHQPELSKEIGLLIFDEGHQFDTGTRGVTYELLISSLKTSIAAETQIILISAVMSNAESIGDWLYGEKGTTVHGTTCLPTQRSIAFSSWTKKLGQLKYVSSDSINHEDFYVPRLIEERNLGRKGRETKDRVFPDRNSPSASSHMSAYWVVKLCQQGPVAIFCGQKSSVKKICDLLIDQYQRGLNLHPPRNFSNEIELLKISQLAEKHYGNLSSYPDAIKLGFLPHSANIPNGIRVSAEFAMQNDMAKAIICTSTLAQGVNLPIKYLVVSGNYQAGEKISTRDFHNLIGRAGRSGLHTEGSIIFSTPDIYDKRKKTFKGRTAWKDIERLLDTNNTEDCLSSLKKIFEPFPGMPPLEEINILKDKSKYKKSVLKHAKTNKFNIDKLTQHIEFKEQSINTIESYILSFISDIDDIPDNLYENIAKGTLAYTLSSVEEKQLLIDAFKIIFNNACNVPVERRAYYGKSLLGINQLNKIYDWLQDNIDRLKLEDSLESILKFIWPLITIICSNKKLQKLQKKPNTEIENNLDDETSPSLIAACAWINQHAYYEIVTNLDEHDIGYQWGKSHRKVTIDNIIELTDQVLGYDCMLIIGAIADIVDGTQGDSEISDKLRRLQKSIKYGLSQPLSIWLYENGLSDRELCKELCQTLVDSGIDPKSFKQNILETNKELVLSILEKYPSYFSR